MQIARLYRLVKIWLAIVVIGFLLAPPSYADLTPNIAVNSVESHAYQKSHITQIQSYNGLASCEAYFKGTLNVNECRIGEVPAPAAFWLFILALLAFVGLSNRSKP